MSLPGDISLGGMKELPSLPPQAPKPWYRSSDWWKKASVWISILLSAISLILGAIGEFKTLASTTQRGLNVSGLIVNSVSVVLSAATSLNWKSPAQIEADLLKELDKLLIQQPVMAQNPSSRPGSAGNPEKPTTRLVHVLKLQHPADESGEGAPLLSGPKATKKKGAKKRKGFGRRNTGSNGNNVGTGVV